VAVKEKVQIVIVTKVRF